MILLQETAPGKLNLTLDILGARPDGYHELEMVMISVSLCDTLTLELGTGAPWTVVCNTPGIPDGPDNLCWKAAQVYCAAAGIEPEGLRIQVEKHIPAQAGMAGGSSDAAAVLRALKIHDVDVRRAALDEVAGDGGRMRAVDGHLRIVALVKPDGLAVK